MLTIAEIGSNYRDFEDILNYIHRLQCSVVKFQYFCPDDLNNKAIHGFGKVYNFSIDHLKEMYDVCSSVGKSLMFSVFNHERVGLVSCYAEYLKIASSEITYIPLIEAMAETEKYIFVSTGGATEKEIGTAVEIIGKDKIILMGCNVEYPTNKSYPMDGKRLGEKYGCRWGYSDHSTEIYLVKQECARLGAYCWEKHVKFETIKSGPDSSFAITVQEFNRAVYNVHAPISNPSKRVLVDGEWIRPR